MSRSPLDFQDFEKSFLFLLSVLKIFVLNFSFSSRFSRFCKTLSLSLLDFQDLKKSFSSLDIQDFVPCFSSKLGLRCLPLTFLFHLRRNILEKEEILQLITMDADGCLLSGAFQDHLLGFQVMTILTGQSHISKVRVIVLYQVSKCTFDVVLKIISLH